MRIANFALLVALAFSSRAMAIDVAFSFEDAPGAASPLLQGERTKTLITALHAAQVEQAIFFAVGKSVEANGTKRLKLYADAGHIIGSQGYSASTIDQLGATAFVQDMKKNDALVRDLPGYQMWLRFPGLNQGSTVEARDTVRVWIYHMLYGRAQVTINSPDDALNRIVQEGVAAGRRVNPEHLRALYVAVMMECIQHYDEMARTVLGTSPKHLLRLHENDLAALFVADLAQAIRQAGGRIIPATDALGDDLNHYEPDLVPINDSQIIAVAKERGVLGVARAAIEDPARLATEVSKANIWLTDAPHP